jgi:cytochrome bd-type quinol oxidase subunit 2
MPRKCALHGSAYAAAKVGEPMSARASSVGRLAAMLFAAIGGDIRIFAYCDSASRLGIYRRSWRRRRP